MVPHDGPLPLSFAQQRLWFLDQFEPGSTQYVTAVSVRLLGPLDTSALEQALTTLVARHESVRTTLDTHDGLGVQIIHPPYDVRIPLLDLSALPDAQREAQITEIVASECAGPFDLRQGPLMRVRLARAAADDHVLLLTMHHVITDGWSMGVLTRELSELYAAAATTAGNRHWRRCRCSTPTSPSGSAASSPAPPWPASWTTGGAQLAGLAPLELPTDRPRPAIRTPGGATCQFTMPADVTAAAARTSPAPTTPPCSWSWPPPARLLFSRWSGQDDIAVGTAISGRDRAELNSIIGFFVNTLVLRSTINSRRHLHRVPGPGAATPHWTRSPTRTCRSSGRRRCPPERDTSRTPLFQAMVALQNLARQPLRLPGLDITACRPPLTTADFDLSIDFLEHGGRSPPHSPTTPTCSTRRPSSGWRGSCACCWPR